MGTANYELAPGQMVGEYRIALFGDSFTEGFRVAREDLFAVLLQQMLNTGPVPEGVRNVRVMNFGMRGEFPAKYYFRLRDQAMPFRPDLVIVQTFDNDPRDKFRDDRESVKELRRIARDGIFTDADPASKAEHPMVKGRAVYLKKIGDRWFVQNRQTEEEKK